MAGLARSHLGTGVKRKLGAITNATIPDGEERAIKRISPFHNTPIQRKETKRRILKISMRKMREIECPETFLRRSVLINNLSRSLQDDLKDDKIWGRWDWAGDMETLPYRTPNANPVVCRDPPPPLENKTTSSCTLLTNTCSSLPVTGNSQWTPLGTQAHWLNSDMDAQMTPLERERITRDLAQSHDRLAATVESLTSFDDFAPTEKVISCVKDPILSSLDSSNAFHQTDKVIGPVGYGCRDQCDPSRTGTLAACSNCSNNSSDLCLLKSDINKNQVFSYKGCRTRSDVTSPLNGNHPALCGGYGSPVHTSISQANTLTTIGECDDSRYSMDNHSGKMNAFEKSPEKDPWSFSCIDYVEDDSTTYLDMTSNSVCRVTTEPSLLDSLESCIPCIETSTHSTNVDMDIAHHETNHSTSPTLSLLSNADSKSCFSTANSTPYDVTSSSCLWNSAYADSGCTLPVPPCPTPVPTVSCSTEADRSECSTSLLSSDQDNFSSQNLRDFDVIYNNLVSVLIGGN